MKKKKISQINANIIQYDRHVNEIIKCHSLCRMCENKFWVSRLERQQNLKIILLQYKFVLFYNEYWTSILTQHKCTLQITLILNDRSSFIHSTEQTLDLSLVHRTLLYIGNHAQELSKSGHGQCNLQKTVANHCQYFRSTVSGCTTYMYDMSLRIW